MLNSVDFSGKPFHFIGIGGIGMSALAYVLAKQRLPVSGSDISLSHITQRLQDQGAHIFWSQDATNLEFFTNAAQREAIASPVAIANLPPLVSSVEPNGCKSQVVDRVADPALPQVICSTAINPNNSEYRAALDLGCPIFHRSDVLAALMQRYRSIAVAGTHGKTTTSSMIGYLLLQTGLDPTIVVGGEVDAWEGNARLGESPYLVAEADESDGSLVKLTAEVGIITNIELDHPDHYQTVDEVVETFQIFAQQCKVLVGCLDCDRVRDDLNPSITYSLDPQLEADYTATDVVYQSDGTIATIWERGKPMGQLKLSLLGQHNLSNALAAIAIGRYLGLEFEAIATVLKTFEGARRRFERKGEYHGISFVDDYAHHPSEIRATLAAARQQLKHSASAGNRLVAVFQPHRYSRTQAFLADFAQCFQDADLVVTTEIYAASEVNSGQISGQNLWEAIASHHPQAIFQPSLSDVQTYLQQTLQPGDLVLFLGAGNLNRILPELIAFFQQLDSAE